MSLRRCTAEHIAALLALGTLLAGVGVLGWLVGHLATYDALGHHHAHEQHGYMDPLVRGGAAGAGAGIALVLVALAFGRRALVALVQRTRGRSPWLLAATLPATTFSVVEVAEGSVTGARLDLLLLGIPLQLVLGAAVLAVVRLVVLGLVRAIELLAGPPCVTDRRPVSARRPRTAPIRRASPMASSAPLRGPPACSSRA